VLKGIVRYFQLSGDSQIGQHKPCIPIFVVFSRLHFLVKRARCFKWSTMFIFCLRSILHYV